MNQLEIYSRKPLFKRRQWYWRLKGRNGKIIDHSSEGYNNKADCIQNLYDIRQTLNNLPNKLEEFVTE